MEKEIPAIQPAEGVQVNGQIQSPILRFPIGEITDIVLERRRYQGQDRTYLCDSVVCWMQKNYIDS